MSDTKAILGLLRDCLVVFNFKRAREMMSMTDDQLWAFINKNRHIVRRYFKREHYPKTAALYGYAHGEKRFREFFFQELEEYREYVVSMLIHDFCLSRQKITLGYWGKSGYLDDPASCNSPTSSAFMPKYDNEDNWHREDLFFHLLEISQVDNIIASMKANINNLQINTPIDISRIKKIRNFCLKHKEFKIIYVYDV